MATRVKKQATVTKEVASPQTSTAKTENTTNTTTKSTIGKQQNAPGIAKRLGKKAPVKNIVKKTVQLKRGRKPRKNALKINPKNLARVLMENGKGLEGKKLLLNNGVKEVVKRGRKPKSLKIKEELEEEPLPVLEPIFPQEENVEVKKTPKKRGRKPQVKIPELIDIKKIKTEIKTEPLDEVEVPIEETAVLLSIETPSPKRKTGRQRKPKPETSSIEEVMSDLSYLLESDQIKKETVEPVAEQSKIEPAKSKRLTKKQRLDLIKEDFIKKENIENTLRKLDPADTKVIDRLDLNVRKIKTVVPTVKRRHSIEKFPIGSVDSVNDGLPSQLSLFNQLPRSISPRTSKRSIKLGSKRASPYTTRSDSPAPRLLRNGKHRKLRGVALLDGLDDTKRRKRMHSDLSGSETASKLSGYDSDSSFSDLASLHDSEKDSDLSKPTNKDGDNLLLDESSNLDSKYCSTPDLIIKETCSTESDKQLIDTNSNVCGDNNSIDLNLNAKSKKDDVTEDIPMEDSPSDKVPEKGLILDIMKQTFNEIGEKEVAGALSSCEVSKFYGKEKTNVKIEHDLRTEKSTQDGASAERGTAFADSLPNLSIDSNAISPEKQTEDSLETTPEVESSQETEKQIAALEDFPLEEEEAGEQASFENIVQGCIDSIGNISPDLPQLPPEAIVEALGDIAPILEKQVITAQDEDKDDSLPIIDNMSTAILEPPNSAFLENLEPPLLESSVPGPEPNLIVETDENDPETTTTNDRHIGIAVTEKDNVVCFSIEHLSDEVEEHDNSNEANQSVEGRKSDLCENGELESAQVTKQIELEKANSELLSTDVNDKMDIDPSEPINDNKQEANVNHNKKTSTEEEEDDQTTEKECDKPSESTDVQTKNTLDASEAIGEKVDVVNTLEEGCTNTNQNNEHMIGEAIDTMDDNKTSESKVEESPEELAQKESILKALGLQSLRAAKETTKPIKTKGKPPTPKGDNYTGTLKTVIKINKKKGKNSFKMTLQKNKNRAEAEHSSGEEGYKILKEGGSSAWKQSKESSDTAGAHRKSHYSNRSNMEGSSEHTSDGEQPGTSQEKNPPEKSLIVPEKASSFSIHPGRLCKDECSYCFGKFGLFDTPCHIAQMKSVERQNKILATEKHLTRDSCLCDACYRHVDRKSNSPSYINKSLKRNSLVAPGPRQNHCHVLGCNNVSSNILRRKWIIKMRKSICQVINIDLDNPGLHSIPICDEHFTALEHLMICAMCKRRLARNHIHYLGPEVMELNEALKDEGIPICLCDKPVVCKLCRCFASIILKDPEERAENSVNFFMEYKKRLLHFNDIVPMDSAAAEEPIVVPNKGERSDKKEFEKDLGKRKKRVRNSSDETIHSGKDSQEDKNEDLNVEDMGERSRTRVHSIDTNNSHSANQSRSQSPDDGDEYAGVDYNTLIPAIALECPSDGETKKDYSRKIVGLQKKIPRFESIGNAIEISRTFKSKADRNRSNDLAAQKLGQNPSISLRPNYGVVEHEPWESKHSGRLISNPSLSVRQLFPGEEDLRLMGNIDFKNVLGRTPEGWEKCVSTIQYDEETKLLWQELQKPYGSKSSFLRHLILLEKYFRNGDLVLSPTATHHAINYRESVHNRLRAYDNIPSSAGNIQPISMIPFNKMYSKNSSTIMTGIGQPGSNGVPPVTISQIGRDNESNQSSKTPITLQQLSQPPLLPTSSMLQNLASKQKSSGAPPGLISIHQNTARTIPATVVRPQMPSQKIKFPITKNWRPNLIPIDPSKKNERKPGLVQVISGGKPYHITLEDYKKMCAIKRSFEAKQKKVQELQMAKQFNQNQQQSILINHNSVLKSVVPKKGLIISKTSGGTVTEGKPISFLPVSNASSTITSGSIATTESSESILEKLDKQVEMLGQGQIPLSLPAITFDKNSAVQIIPRIPKSLTVIPQTVRKSGPPSPVLYITPKNSSSNSTGISSNENSNQP